MGTQAILERNLFGLSPIRCRVLGDRASRLARVLFSILCVAGLAAGCASPYPRPNFIVINLDDARADGVDRMPVVQSVLAGEGVTFEHSFTPNAECCPSRASILTGLYAVNHRTFTVFGTIGGAKRFREGGGDQETIAVWLRDAGYRTGLFGKYLNLYSDPTEGDRGPEEAFYLPPGWDRWWAMISPEGYGGIHGSSYEIIEEDGTRTLFEDHSTDAEYSTDLSAEVLRRFITDSVHREKPFFAVWAPFAPHHGRGLRAQPADRHFGKFDDPQLLSPFRPPSYDEPDVGDKPRWIQAHPQGKPLTIAATDQIRIRAYEALLAADEQIGAILEHLDALGIDRDTAIFLTSDNGASWGEHRRFFGMKGCAYEECQRVPLIVRYPRRVPPGIIVSDNAVLNVDIPPTLAAMADVEVPVSIDGLGFEDSLYGGTIAKPRTDYLLEHWRKSRGHILTISGLVADGDRVRLDYGVSKMLSRSSVVFEFDSDRNVSDDSISVPIIRSKPGRTLMILESRVRERIPDVATLRLPNALTVIDETAEQGGVIWRIEVNQKGVLGARFQISNEIPDFFGVRDVAGGFTWVEYETGEVELYDLDADPFQLENVANDPTYAKVRTRLEARLRELLEQAAGNALGAEPVSK